MASTKSSGKRGGKKPKRDPNELDEMSDDMTQRGEAAGLGDDENPGGGEIDEVVEVAEIDVEGELIPEGRESGEEPAEGIGDEPVEAERPASSGTGRGKAGNGDKRRQRRASKPRTPAKAKSGSKRKR